MIDSAKTFSPDDQQAIVGCLLGCALGDSIGLPFEGVSARRIERLNPGPLSQRLLFGHGMLSDDTEHTCLVAQALIASGGDADDFGRNLAWRLRWWFLALPAGIGFGTLRSALKLWLGFPYTRSGVNSAGNGPMMRSAILGAWAVDDADLRESLVGICSRISHADPRAERAAQVVAAATALALRRASITPAEATRHFAAWMHADAELTSLVERAARSAETGESARQFCTANNLGKGVSGYCYSTLAVVLQIWMRHYDDVETAITEAVRCGGDTDTVAAIVGGIVGARAGRNRLPRIWLECLSDWPRSVAWIESLGERLYRCKVEGGRVLYFTLFYKSPAISGLNRSPVNALGR